jgi:hypothetical protein
MAFQCARGAWSKNEEPSLDELLAEPAVQLVMAKDGWEDAKIRRLAAWVRASRRKLIALEERRAEHARQC